VSLKTLITKGSGGKTGTSAVGPFSLTKGPTGETPPHVKGNNGGVRGKLGALEAGEQSIIRWKGVDTSPSIKRQERRRENDNGHILREGSQVTLSNWKGRGNR